MSALNFQNVMAHLIRFPEQPLDAVESKLNFPELSAEEKAQLEKMATDPLVRKFGRKMSYCRRRDATQILRLARDFIPEEVLDRMFYERFERSGTTTDLVMVGVQFVDFLLADSDCSRHLDECPPFTRDVLRYEGTKAYIVRQVIKNDDPTLPDDTLLRHKAYRIIDIEYDVPSIDMQKQKDLKAVKSPEPKEMKLIFMRSEEPPF